MQLKGSFQITDWQESTDKQFDDGGKLSTAAVCQDYSGDITGKSELKYQMNYRANGTASFIGFEYITGLIANKPCRLTLKHDGQFEAGKARSRFVVIDCSLFEELTGTQGHFESAEGEQAHYVIG